MYSTIQDMGRFGYQEFGVPYSGAMDSYAAKIVNLLLGNDVNAAVLEMTMTGPTLQFDCSTVVCISGAEMSAKLNGLSIENNKLIAINKGGILSFGKLKLGLRAYLGVLGGFKTETVMKSRSMYPGITLKSTIRKNDLLPIESKTLGNLHKNASMSVNREYIQSKTIDVYKGPEFDKLSKEAQKRLLNSEFSISNNNSRMAYQLQEVLKNNLEPIITSAVMPGTVQLTPAGKLIVLMRDCQTTGGYPRVLQLKASALNILAQKFTGQKIRFNLN